MGANVKMTAFVNDFICSGWSQEQGRDSGGVWGPILSLPSSSRPHLSDAHLVISFCPSPSNLVRGGRIWSRRWRGSSEMEPLCHCLTGDHPHAVLGSAKFDAGRLEKLEDALVEQMLTWMTALTWDGRHGGHFLVNQQL